MNNLLETSFNGNQFVPFVDGLPAELKGESRWLILQKSTDLKGWAVQDSAGRKVPANSRSSWLTFDEACERCTGAPLGFFL